MVSLVLVVIAGNTAITILHDVDQAKGQLIQETETVNKVLTQDFVRLLLTDKADIAADIISKLQSFTLVLHADLINEQGDYLLHFSRITNEPHLAAIDYQEAYRFDNKRLLKMFPVVINDKKIGIVRYAISTQKIDDRLHVVIRLMLVTAFCSVLFALLGAMYLQRFFTSPLKGLTKKTKEIAKAHDYTLRITEDELDKSEIGVLQRSFNAMLSQIEKANHRVTEQKERLEVTLNSIGDAVIVTDIEGHVVSMNPVAITLTGWSFEEAEGNHLHDVFHIINTRSREVADCPVSTVLKTGHTVGLANHTTLLSRDGNEYQIMDSAAPIKDNNEKLLGVILVFHNVTEQYEDRRRVEESEERLRMSQLYGNIGTWEADFITHQEIWSEAVTQVLGFPDIAEPTWEDFLATIHPEDRNHVTEVINQHLNEGKECDVEYRIVDTQGKIRWMRSVGKSEFDSNGKPLKMRGTVQDITEHKKAEKAHTLHLRFLENMTRIDHVIQQANDIEQMMPNILQAILEIFETDRAWLLYPCDPDAESWNVPIERTRPEYPGALNLGEEIPMRAEIADAFRKALDRDDVITIDYRNSGTAQETAEQFSTLAEIHMAVYPQTGKPWLFGMHQCSYYRNWTDDEKDLFREIGHRLGDALSSRLFLRNLQESEERFRNVFDTEPECVKILNPDNTLVSMNPAGLAIIEAESLDTVKGQSILPIVNEEYRDDFKKLTDKVCNKGESGLLVFRATGLKGTSRWLETHAAPLRDAAGKIIGLISITRDITESKRAESLLKESEERNRLLLDSTAEAIYGLDLEGNCTFCNAASLRMLGYEKQDDLLGKNMHELIHHTRVDGAPYPVQDCRVHKAFINNEKSHVDTEVLYRKDGSSFPAEYWSYPVIREGHTIGCVVTFLDITDRKQADELLSFQASHDNLTGLVNRLELERRVERLLTTIRQDKTEHALCFMDLDQFKVVNDTCGHTAGDEMLRQLGVVLQNAVRHRDTLARLGGDEFAVLMEHCSLDHAHKVAISLHKAIQDFQFSWEENTFKIGVSIGLTPITEDLENFSAILKQADAACYMAKDLGRNRIQIYHPDDTDLAQRHGEMQWVARIYQALEQHRFCLYAQVIEPFDNHHEKHYELLLRMKDEQGKLIPPGAFLPAAERYNLIEQLDRWVIEKAFLFLAENPEFLKRNHLISINLSGQSLAKQEFLDFILSQLEISGIAGDNICFEITETAAISNLNTAIKFITTLKKVGCRFSLDDFGSGFSSFRYLKNLPVDYLKIDGMFVRDIVDDPIDYAMVKSINEIGQVMGMQTIAEFVENEEIKEMLRKIGVNFVQGYGIGKPQAFEELL